MATAQEQDTFIMSNIQFIPLVEPSTEKDIESTLIPNGTSLSNTIEWDIYQEREIKKNYRSISSPILPGIYQYRLLEMEIDDIEKLVALHIGDMNINESISLFGGYAISVNNNIELLPQCCGLLEDIQQWQKLLQKDFEDFYLANGHPTPLITKRGNEVIIHCKDDNEQFIPSSTKQIIRLDYHETKTALLKTIKDLNDFSTRLNTISHKFQAEDLARILVWGKSETK